MNIRCCVLLAVLALLPFPKVVAQVVAPGKKPAALKSEIRLCAGSEDEAVPPRLTEPLPQPTAGPSRAGAFTLADLEAMAQGNNPTLMVAGARVQAAQGAAVQAGLYPNPQIGYMGTEIGNEGQAGLQGAFIEQEFVRGGKLRLSRAAAGQEVRRAQALFAAQQQRVLTDVRVGFYEVLAAQQAVEHSGQLVRVGDEGVKVVEDLLESQEVAPADRLQARIEANSARIVLKNAQNRLHSQWQRLAAVLGQPDQPCARVVGSLEEGLPQHCWGEALAMLLNQSPELAAAHAEVDRAAWALRRARAEPIPNVTVQAGVQYDDSTKDTVANLEVGLPLPIFDCNQGNIEKASGELRIAQGQVRRLELALHRRLAEVFERYANALQQVEIYDRDILPDSQKSLELVTAGYQQGEFGYVSVLTAQRTYFQTTLARLEALLELRRSAAQIEGLLLDDNLEAE